MKGVGLSGLILAVTFIGQILSVPVFLAAWGASIYGEWLVLVTTALTLNMLNLGIQTYTVNLLIKHNLAGETADGARILHSALRLYILLGGAGVTVTLGLAFWPGSLAALNITQIPPAQARLILLIYGLIATYGIFGGLLMGQFKVIQQMPRQLAYSLVERCIFLFVPLALAWLGYQPLAAALGVGVLFTAVTLIELGDIAKRSAFPLGIRLASWQTARSLVGPSLIFFVITLSTVLLSTGMNLVITRSSGAAAVALFSATIMLINFIRTSMLQGLNVLWPEITSAGALCDDPERLKRWHRLAVKAGAGFSTFCAGGIAAFGYEFLTRWTGGELVINRQLLLLLTLYLILLSPGLISSVFGLALNRQSDIIKVQVFLMGFGLAGAAFLIPAIGLPGAALALCVGQIIMLPVQVKQSASWTADRLGDYWQAVMLKWALFSFSFFSISVLMGFVQSFEYRLLAFSLSALVFLYTYNKLGFTFEERSRFVRGWRN